VCSSDLELRALRDRILKRLQEAGSQPPEAAELIQEFKTDKGNLEKILRLLVRQGALVRVGEGLFYPVPTLKEIERKLVEYLQKGVTVEVPKFKELFGITRKWAIPLLEYFDANRVTLRVGNARKLYPKKDK
jgi:selenocysteine-specific elongation factor